MKKASTKVAATLEINGAAKFTAKGRESVAAWLERQAKYLRRSAGELSPRFRARYLYVPLLCLVMTSLAGCGVPRTRVNFNIGATHFTGTFPKQFVATNIVAEIDTNGLARFSVGYMESKNDAAVIDKAAAGDVARINATAAAALQLMGATAQLAK